MLSLYPEESPSCLSLVKSSPAQRMKQEYTTYHGISLPLMCAQKTTSEGHRLGTLFGAWKECSGHTKLVDASFAWCWMWSCVSLACVAGQSDPQGGAIHVAISLLWE